MSLRIVRSSPLIRHFHSLSPLRLAAPVTSKYTSLFGDLTSDNNNNNNNKRLTRQVKVASPEEEAINKEESIQDILNYGKGETKKVKIDPKDDKSLQRFLNPAPYITKDSLLSPLKRKIYSINVAKNGFFKNDQLVNLQGSTDANGQKYEASSFKLKLTQSEIEALEPSIYLRSWRIKSSVKKVNIVLRALKGLSLKRAITELHFMHKKVSRDLSEMLERGLKDCEAMNYDPDEVYISESWVCTDGKWSKRLDCKGRGRTGIIQHRYVNVRFLLKTKQTKLRLQHEKQTRLSNRRVYTQLNKEPIRGAAPGFYRW